MKARFVISKNFKQLVKANRWTVKYLAQELRYKEPQVSQIMSGEIEPSMRFLHRLCSFSGATLTAVLDTKFDGR